MRKTALFIATLIACVGANATSESRSTSSSECVFARSIHGFRALDRNHLVIWSPARRDAYLVRLAGSSPDLRFAHRLAFVDRNGDGRVCGYGMDRIAMADSAFPHPATIVGMTRLDEERLGALEEQYDVRLTRKSRTDKDGATHD